MKIKLSKELEKQDPEELLRLIKEMARRFPIANMYLNMEFGLESEAVIQKYKKLLDKEYFPTRGHGKARSTRAIRTLKEFEKLAVFDEDMVDMRWHQIELAAKYHVAHRYMYEPFIQNFYSLWNQFIQRLHDAGLVETYRERVEKLLSSRFGVSHVGPYFISQWEKGPEEKLEEETDE